MLDYVSSEAKDASEVHLCQWCGDDGDQCGATVVPAEAAAHPGPGAPPAALATPTLPSLL